MMTQAFILKWGTLNEDGKKTPIIHGANIQKDLL